LETPYSGISKIKEAATLQEANDLLAQVFVLVKAMERIVYVVGLPREAGQQTMSNNGKNERPGNGSPADTTILGLLHWKKFKSSGGEWTLLLGPDDALLPELEPAKQFIEMLRKEKEVILGGWHYRISKERFLNRFPTQKTEVK
jgi:hypothetical protein